MTASEAAKRWRVANPGRVEAYNASRRVLPALVMCEECGAVFEGRSNRLLCSRRCKDARYRRLHPVENAAKQARKYRRRQERAA